MATSNDNSFKPVFSAFASWFVCTKPVVVLKTAIRTVWKWSIQARLETSVRKFIRAHDKYVSRRERLRALREFRESPEHVAEVLDLARFWALVRRALVEDEPELPSGPGAKVVDLRERLDTETRQRLAAQEEERIARERALRRRALQIMVGTAAAVTLVPSAMVVAGIWRGRSVETKLGDWLRLTLSDGTVVNLQPLTRLEWRFSDDQRFVRVPHGAAYFEVAKDAARPFVVDAVKAEVRAIGTAFEVRHRDERVIVTVREGKVQVTRKGRRDFAVYPTERGGVGNPGVSVPATVSQQVVVSGREPVIAKQVNLDIELAWTKGQIAFETGASLADVVAESNRLNVVQVVLEDPTYRQRGVRGVYAANDPKGLADQLALEGGLTILQGRNVLRLLGSGVERMVPEEVEHGERR